MKRTIAAILALCLAALTASCSALDFKDHNKAIEKALMESGLNVSAVRAQNSNDGTAINLSVDIDSKSSEFSTEDLRTVLGIVLKDTPRTYDIAIYVHGPNGELVNLEPAYLALGFPTQLELYVAAYGPVNEANGSPVEPRAFDFGRDYTEKILNK